MSEKKVFKIESNPYGYSLYVYDTRVVELSYSELVDLQEQIETITKSKGLVPMGLEQILANWNPGSQTHTWFEEYFDLTTRDKERTDKLREAIEEHGFGLADETAPIKLGNDGRVWNGHHRIVIAMGFGYKKPLMVEIVGPEERE